ncbi:MAG: hypothetical protein WCO93_13075 [bacterium]
MIKNKSICGLAILSLLFVIVSVTNIFAQQQKSSLNGKWAVKYADSSESIMIVEKNTFNLIIPKVGKIKGMIQERGDYFESILSDRRNGINFIYGYIKNGRLEGKLQEQMPCSELKKAFKSGVADLKNSCQMPFTAVKKEDTK